MRSKSLTILREIWELSYGLLSLVYSTPSNCSQYAKGGFTYVCCIAANKIRLWPSVSQCGTSFKSLRTSEESVKCLVSCCGFHQLRTKVERVVPSQTFMILRGMLLSLRSCRKASFMSFRTPF